MYGVAIETDFALRIALHADVPHKFLVIGKDGLVDGVAQHTLFIFTYGARLPLESPLRL